MADTFTEYTPQGFGSRIGNSIKGVVVGFVMFVGSFILLAWNEKRAVTEIRTLEEGRKLVISVQADAVSAALDGSLVFTTGLATTSEVLADPIFGVSSVALKLKRVVEMYQWDEDEDTEGAGNDRRKVYRYDRKWTEKLISSSSFRHESGHENPGTMPFRSDEMIAEKILLGPRQLSSGLVSQISNYTALPATDAAAQAGARLSKKAYTLSGGGVFYGTNPNQPAIGDLRVQFHLVHPGPVSLIAMQQGHEFAPFRAKAGNTIELLEVGTHDSDYVLDAALKRNTVLTWIFRGVGTLFMFIGVLCILGPLVTLTEVIPILGSIVGLGVGLAAFVLAISVSILTIALSWLAVRPLAGGAALLLLVLFIWGAKRKGDKRIEVHGRPSVPPPPPPPA